MLKRYDVKTRKGFSILETVVSLAIITIGIIGILSLFTQTIRSGEMSFNQEIAANLAQEGIEVIRNKRDSNWMTIPKIDWNYGITATEYKVNFKNDIWEIVSANGFQQLYLRDNKIYTHEITDTLTIFERKIEIDNSEENILKITSTVQWTERGNTQPQKIIMKDNLYNWQ